MASCHQGSFSEFHGTLDLCLQKSRGEAAFRTTTYVCAHFGGTRKLPSSAVQQSVVTEAADERPKSHRVWQFAWPTLRGDEYPG